MPRRALLVAVAASLLATGITGVTAAAPAQAADCSFDAKSVATRYPKLETDKYWVVFLDGCALDKKWDASRRGTDISLWQPKAAVWQTYPAAQGWRFPGDLPVSAPNGSNFKLDPPENYMTFLIKAKDPTALRNPDRFTKIWDSHSTGGRGDIVLYEPVCPENYDALGLTSTPYATHSTDTVEPNLGIGDNGYGVGCFSRSITYQLEPATTGSYDKGALWDTRKNLKGSADVAFYAVQRPAGPVSVQNTAILPPPTFWAKKNSYDAPPATKFRGLAMPLKSPMTTPSGLQDPQLTSKSPASVVEQKKIDSYEVSSLLVTDDYYGSEIAKFRNSPVYKVVMTTTWKPVDGGVLCAKGGSPCGISSGKEESTSESTTWNNTIGGSVTASASTEVKASAGVVGTGITLSLAIEVSYSHEFGGETSKGSSTSNGVSGTIDPGQFGVYFRAQTEYKIYRKDKESDDNLVRPSTKAVSGPAFLAFYPSAQPVNTDCTKTGRDRNLVACPLPTTATDAIPRGEQVFSDSGNHYLLLSKGGTLEVRESDQGVEQSEGALWYLDKNHAYGTLGHAISKVSFADGRLRVSAAGLNDWCSTKETHPGAKLDIAADGILRVVDAANAKKVFWSSKFDTAKEGGC